MLHQWQKEVNDHFFSNIISTLKEGGVYMWKSTGNIYFRRGNGFVCHEKKCEDDMKEITTAKFHKRIILEPR